MGNAPQCDCTERNRQEREGLFVPVANLDGWVFPEAPLRRATPLAIYYADGRGTHDGEPYVWVDCPFCHLELPLPPEVTWRNDSTGDPDE